MPVPALAAGAKRAGARAARRRPCSMKRVVHSPSPAEMNAEGKSWGCDASDQALANDGPPCSSPGVGHRSVGVFRDEAPEMTMDCDDRGRFPLPD